MKVSIYRVCLFGSMFALPSERDNRGGRKVARQILKEGMMIKNACAEVAFLLLLVFLMGGWVFVQVSGFRSQEDIALKCQIVGVALETHKKGSGGRDIYRVTINTDSEVDYKITKPTADKLLLVEMPGVCIAPALQTELLANDLVEDIWMRTRASGRVTVGVELASAQVRVSDRAMDAPAQGVVIDLEPRGETRVAMAPRETPEWTGEGRLAVGRFAGMMSEWILISAPEDFFTWSASAAPEQL